MRMMMMIVVLWNPMNLILYLNLRKTDWFQFKIYQKKKPILMYQELEENWILLMKVYEGKF